MGMVSLPTSNDNHTNQNHWSESRWIGLLYPRRETGSRRCCRDPVSRKETDREEGDDIRLLEFATAEYGKPCGW